MPTKLFSRIRSKLPSKVFRKFDSEITDFTVSASQSRVILSSSSVVTGNTITITITAKNAIGQGLSGKVITSVTLAPPGSGVVSGSGSTNVAGNAFRTITTADIANGNTVTVVCDGVSISQIPTFNVTASGPSAASWGDSWGNSWGDSWGL